VIFNSFRDKTVVSKSSIFFYYYYNVYFVQCNICRGSRHYTAIVPNTEPSLCFQIIESLLKNVTKKLLDSSEEDISWYLQNVAPENHGVCSWCLIFLMLTVIALFIKSYVVNV